jgi:hypothetical protein
MEQQLPVGDEPKRRRDIRPKKRHGVAREKAGDQRYAKNEGDERGQQPASSPCPKLPQRCPGPSAGPEEVEQQLCDQKSRYHKENIYAEVTTGEPRRVKVVDDDGDNCDPTDAV